MLTTKIDQLIITIGIITMALQLGMINKAAKEGQYSARR